MGQTRGLGVLGETAFYLLEKLFPSTKKRYRKNRYSYLGKIILLKMDYVYLAVIYWKKFNETQPYKTLVNVSLVIEFDPLSWGK